MEKLAVVITCAVIGLGLYWRSNRVYNRLALGENLSGGQHLAAVGLTGLSATILFIGLVLFMSFQAPDFVWDQNRIAGVVIVAIIVGLVVAGVTAAKIYAFRRWGK